MPRRRHAGSTGRLGSGPRIDALHGLWAAVGQPWEIERERDFRRPRDLSDPLWRAANPHRTHAAEYRCDLLPCLRPQMVPSAFLGAERAAAPTREGEGRRPASHAGNEWLLVATSAVRMNRDGQILGAPVNLWDGSLSVDPGCVVWTGNALIVGVLDFGRSWGPPDRFRIAESSSTRTAFFAPRCRRSARRLRPGRVISGGTARSIRTSTTRGRMGLRPRFTRPRSRRQERSARHNS